MRYKFQDKHCTFITAVEHLRELFASINIQEQEPKNFQGSKRKSDAPDVWLELPYVLGSSSCWFSNAELIHFNAKR